MTALCNQPEAFASDLGDDQSHYLCFGDLSAGRSTKFTCSEQMHWTGNVGDVNIQWHALSLYMSLHVDRKADANQMLFEPSPEN